MKALKLTIHSFKVFLLAVLQQDKAFIEICLEYIDYAYIFSLDLAIKLPQNISINKYAIKLIEDKQLPYGPIYSLKPVKYRNSKHLH